MEKCPKVNRQVYLAEYVGVFAAIAKKNSQILDRVLEALAPDDGQRTNKNEEAESLIENGNGVVL